MRAVYEVASNPAASSVSLTQSASTGYTNETEITYTATATGAQNGVTYNFKVDGTSVQNTTSTTYKTTYTSSGSKSVTVSVEKSGYDTVTSSAVTTKISDRPSVYFKKSQSSGNAAHYADSTEMTYDPTTSKYKLSVDLDKGSSGNWYYIVIYDSSESENLSYNNGTLTETLLTSGGYTIYSGDNNVDNPLHIVASVTGTYNFYFDAATNKLYVECPHTVTFDKNGHGTAPAAQVITYGGTATEPTALTESGYGFGGWYTSKTTQDSTTLFDFSTAITADTTLYAKWTPNSHSVTYPTTTTGYGLSGTMPTTAGYNDTVSFNVAPQDNYRIVSVTYTYGSTTKNATAGSNNEYHFTMPDADVTVSVTAVRTYTVSLSTNTGVTVKYSTDDGTTKTALPSTGTVTVDAGTVVKFYATYTAGYKFASKSDNLTASASNTEFTTAAINANTNASISASQITLQVDIGAYKTDDISTTDFTPLSGYDPTISPALTSGTTPWSSSASTVTKNASTPAGYEFVGWYYSDTAAFDPATISKSYSVSGTGNTQTFTPNGTEGTNKYSVYALYKKTKYTVVGSFQSSQWSATDDTGLMSTTNGTTYTWTKNFTANQTVTFKIVTNNAFDAKTFVGDGITYTSTGEKTLTQENVLEKAITLNVTYSGDYVFSLNPSTKKLTITYPTRNVSWQTHATNYAIDPAATYISSTAYASGDTWNLVATDDLTYEFKSWTWTVDGVANASGVTVADASKKSTTATVTTTGTVVFIANYEKTGDRTVKLYAKGTNDGSTYGETLATAGITYKIADGSSNAYTTDITGIANGSKFEVTAPATITKTVGGVARTYEFVDWYDGSSSVASTATYTINPLTANKDLTARYRAQLYITVYNSYLENTGTFTFDAAPPRTVVVSDGTNTRTYTYSGSGTYEQCGEDNEPYLRLSQNNSMTAPTAHIVEATGTYYEGNKLLVYPGETVTLNYSGLASSDAIAGVFYNNSIRYSTNKEPDNIYTNRLLVTAGSGTDDNYGTSAGTAYTLNPAVDTIYAVTSSYPGASSYTYDATINQENHSVTFTATQDYLNVDIVRVQKKQLTINGEFSNDTYDGFKIENLNTEGYYYVGEADSDIKVSLVASSDSTMTFTGVNTVKDAASGGSDVSGVTITAYNSSNATIADPVANAASVSYYIISFSAMPNSNVFITIGIKEEFNMKLANIVVADKVGNKTMLTEGSTGYIGTISAMVKTGADVDTTVGTSGDISSDGTYYIYPSNNTSSLVHIYQNSNHNTALHGGVNRDGTAVTGGQTVTYKFEFADGNDALYSFVGWFEGTATGDSSDTTFTVDYTKKLSGKSTYICTPDRDMVIIAVATRDIYLGGNFNSDGEYSTSTTTWSQNRIRMSYDPTYVNPEDSSKKGRYYYEFPSVTTDTEYQFRCYDTVGTGESGQDSVNLTAWKQWNGESYGQDNDDILFAREKHSGDAQSTAGFMFKTNTDSKSINSGTKTSTKNHEANGYGNPVTVYFYAYDGGISVTSTYQWAMAYVSAGAGVDCTNFNSHSEENWSASYNTPTVSVAATTASGATVSTTTQATKYGNNNRNHTNYESIIECQVKEPNGQIVVTASPADANQELQAFVCYNIDTKDSWAVYDFTSSGSGSATTYTGNITIPQNSKIYVVPVYKFTDAYITSSGLETHTVYVRTEDIDKNAWGGLVSMYSWGEFASSGVWPGQVMIPSDDGTSFYAPLTFASNGLEGVTFNNYAKIYDGAGANFLSTYSTKSVSSTNYASYNGTSTDNIRCIQVYDYREPVSIIDNINNKTSGVSNVYSTEDMTLTFAIKPGNKNGSNFSSGDYSSSYSYEYLTDRTGKKRVDLMGNTATGTATYYVVCNYTEGYYGNNKTETYEHTGVDLGDSKYLIDWTVYNTNGTKVAGGTNWLSASYTDVTLDDDSYLTDIAKAVLDAGEPVDGKAVMIAYEDPQYSSNNDGFGNTLAETIRYSGQWYADGVNSLIDVNVDIGVYADGIYTPSGSANPGYASASVSLASGTASIEGEDFSSAYPAKVSSAHANNRKVQLTVNTTDNFLGWFYYDEATETYKQVPNTSKTDATITPSFNSDMTYYAFYNAQASYVVNYIGRDGKAKTFTAQGYDVTDAELNVGGTLDQSSRSSDITEKLAKAVSNIGVFNQTYNLVLSSPTSTAYTLTYTAEQDDEEYTLKVYYYNSNGSLVSTPGTITGNFNKEIDLIDSEIGTAGTALTVNHPSGKPYFVGWKKFNGTTTFGEVLSTHANFGLALSEDLTIAPFFSDAAPTDTAWHAYVDRNEITQELTSATEGTIYNDSIVRFRYGPDSAVQANTDNDIAETGLVIFAQGNEADSTQKSAFNSITAENMQHSFEANLKGKNKESGKLNSTTYGRAYGFYIQTEELSRLNRADICQALDYAIFNGGQYKVMSYIKIGNQYLYSSVTSGDYNYTKPGN